MRRDKIMEIITKILSFLKMKFDKWMTIKPKDGRL
jgi:hypothetical protein